MTKPVVVFDLDDTLINLKAELYRLLNENYGHRVDVPHWSLWEVFDVEGMVGITHEELIAISIEDKTFRKTQPHLFAKYILKDLHFRGYHVVVLTARGGFVPNPYEETEAYLLKHDLHFDELIISDVGGNKVDSLDHIDQIHFTIDDGVHNCEDFAESGKFEHVFLHAQAHNRSCHDFIRIHNLYQMYPHVGLE